MSCKELCKLFLEHPSNPFINYDNHQTALIKHNHTTIVMSSLEIISVVLLSIELFHILAHLNVLFRYKPPSLDNLKDRRYYFVFDGLSHFLPWLIHGRFFYYVAFQAIAHAYYVWTWNKGHYAIRIRDWSVKEYRGKWITVDFFLTWSDIIGHSLNVYALAQFLLSAKI